MSLFDPEPYDTTPTEPRDPRQVACEQCGQPAGSPCLRPSGHTVFGHGYHAIRRDATERQARSSQ